MGSNRPSKLACITSSREKKGFYSIMKVGILFFICLSIVGQSFEEFNYAIKGHKDLDNELAEMFYGRPCIIDEQCLKVSYCDRSQGLFAKVGVKIDGKCSPRAWFWVIFVSVAIFFIAIAIFVFCTIIKCIISAFDCCFNACAKRQVNLEARRLFISPKVNRGADIAV